MAYKETIVWYCPNEAHQIASVFEKKAVEVNELASRLEKIKNTLDSSWEGKSKNNFMATFEDIPRLRAYASELNARAKEIRSISVSRVDRTWVEDPQPAAYTPQESGGGGGHSFTTSSGSGNSNSCPNPASKTTNKNTGSKNKNNSLVDKAVDITQGIGDMLSNGWKTITGR